MTTPEGAKGWVDRTGSAQVPAGGHGLDVAPDAQPGGSERRPADANVRVGGEPSNAPIADRWHTQTALGGDDLPVDERDACVRACITSLLGLPLDAVENVQGHDWWSRWQEFVGGYGYELLVIYPKQMFSPPSGYWLAVVPSLTMKANHCVVAKGRKLFHDPGMRRKYTTEEWDALWADDGMIYEGWLLVPLDPAVVT